MSQFYLGTPDKRRPLSLLQEWVWQAGKGDSPSVAHNPCARVELNFRPDLEVLERALAHVVNRHTILSIRVIEEGGDIWQIVDHSAGVYPIYQQDLRTVARESVSSRVERRIREESVRKFQLRAGPLFRAHLLRLSEQEHLFLLSVHRMVADAQSLQLLMSEISRLYDAFQRGEPDPLPPLPLQYADHALRQRERLGPQEIDRQRQYWQRQLLGGIPVEIPTTRPRTPVVCHDVACIHWSLPSELCAQLSRLACEQHVGLETVLLSAFQILLARYTGQTHFLMGLTLHGRSTAESLCSVGLFANTLPLRADLSGEPDWRQFVVRVRDQEQEARLHQDIPFESLLTSVPGSGKSAGQDLCRVLFCWEMPVSKRQDGTSWRAMITERAVERSELRLRCHESARQILGTVEYRTALFDATAVECLMGHWLALLNAIVANPDERILVLHAMASEEERKLPVEWNGTALEYPENVSIHDLLAAQARRVPDRLAVEAHGQRLSYRDLDERSDQLAHYLRGLGVGPDVVVGLLTQRSIWMLIGILGILKAGGAYLPLDPALPRERREFMLRDAGVPVLLTEQSLLEHVPELNASLPQVLQLDGQWPEIAAAPAVTSRSGAVAGNLAYVIYTSGSTGEPKGVMVPHRCVVNLLVAARTLLRIAESDVWLCVTPLTFDVSVLELFYPLAHGGRIVLVDRDIAVDPVRLAKVVNESAATILQATPATWRLLLGVGWTPPRHLTVISAGEALLREAAGRLSGSARECWNCYGPTETTVYSTGGRVTPGPAHLSVPIGRPFANTSVYILDEQLRCLPGGAVGELWIGGKGLARGYLGRPALTSERYVPSPFQAGERLYRTGDRVRWLAGGMLEYVGRMDDQVKVRGYRIELAEIEHVLQQHPSVTHAVVMLRADGSDEQQLIAYVSVGDANPPVGALRAHMKERLPDYMVPVAFVLLERLPLSANGKIDRSRLLEMEPITERAAYVAPRTPTQQALIAIWMEILCVQSIGIEDDFFALGGHSFAATRVSAHIRAKLGVDFPVVLVFEKPSIAAASQYIDMLLSLQKMQREMQQDRHGSVGDSFVDGVI